MKKTTNKFANLEIGDSVKKSIKKEENYGKNEKRRYEKAMVKIGHTVYEAKDLWQGYLLAKKGTPEAMQQASSIFKANIAHLQGRQRIKELLETETLQRQEFSRHFVLDYGSGDLNKPIVEFASEGSELTNVMPIHIHENRTGG